MSVVKKEYYLLAQFEEALLHAGGGFHCCFSWAIDNTRLAGFSLLVCVSWLQSRTNVLGHFRICRVFFQFRYVFKPISPPYKQRWTSVS